jgi:hypothetical protein
MTEARQVDSARCPHGEDGGKHALERADAGEQDGLLVPAGGLDGNVDWASPDYFLEVDALFLVGGLPAVALNVDSVQGQAMVAAVHSNKVVFVKVAPIGDWRDRWQDAKSEVLEGI